MTKIECPHKDVETRGRVPFHPGVSAKHCKDCGTYWYSLDDGQTWKEWDASKGDDYK